MFALVELFIYVHFVQNFKNVKKIPRKLILKTFKKIKKTISFYKDLKLKFRQNS